MIEMLDGVVTGWRVSKRGTYRPLAQPVPACPCRHCHEKPGTRPRGLCWGCWQDRDIRRLYPSTSIFASRPMPDDNIRHRRRPPAPTTATPGSPAKVEVLGQRIEEGYGLWHPLDARRDVT